MKKHILKALNAFTLAEVLTTLMVIGVVAAMTIPSLYNSYREQADITLMKKANAVYTSFIKSFLMENNLSSEVDAANFFWNEEDCKFITKYFNVASEDTSAGNACTFMTPDGLTWEFYVDTMNDKTYQDGLITKVYLPKKKNIKINGEEVKFQDGTTTNYFYFYFHSDGNGLWINDPNHVPWLKAPGRNWCGSHPFGEGCNTIYRGFAERENLYHQFINKEYTQYNWNF